MNKKNWKGGGRQRGMKPCCPHTMRHATLSTVPNGTVGRDTPSL